MDETLGKFMASQVGLTSRMGMWLEHRIATIVMGVILVATGFFELSDTVLERMIGIQIRAEYGLMLFGLSQGLKGLVEVIEGSRHIKRTRGGET
jgi:hypothetical protein